MSDYPEHAKRASTAARGLASLKLIVDTAIENGWVHERSWGLERFTRAGHLLEVDVARGGRVLSVWGDNHLLPIRTREEVLNLLREEA